MEPEVLVTEGFERVAYAQARSESRSGARVCLLVDLRSYGPNGPRSRTPQTERALRARPSDRFVGARRSRKPPPHRVVDARRQKPTFRAEGSIPPRLPVFRQAAARRAEPGTSRGRQRASRRRTRRPPRRVKISSRPRPIRPRRGPPRAPRGPLPSRPDHGWPAPRPPASGRVRGSQARRHAGIGRVHRPARGPAARQVEGAGAPHAG